jgi:hypothetical protein
VNLLQIVQEFCGRTGLRKPSSVASSQDPQILQIQALANEICEELGERWTWETCRRQALFTSIADEDQGEIAAIADNFFLSITENTFYDRTQHLPINGPVSAEEWQAIKALANVGSLYRYRIWQGHLYLTPVPTAGHTFAFEYTSSALIYNSDDIEYKALFTKDTDTFLLDQKLILQGLRWKWKSEKGLPYAEEKSLWEQTCNDLGGRSGGRKTLSMGGASNAIVPGIFVPAGSWNV